MGTFNDLFHADRLSLFHRRSHERPQRPDQKSTLDKDLVLSNQPFALAALPGGNNGLMPQHTDVILQLRYQVLL